MLARLLVLLALALALAAGPALLSQHHYGRTAPQAVLERALELVH